MNANATARTARKFRKKPVVVEAVQFWSDNEWPKGVCDGGCPRSLGLPHIHTLESVMLVTEGDWIVTGIQGERYAVKPDIFAETYEEVR